MARIKVKVVRECFVDGSIRRVGDEVFMELPSEQSLGEGVFEKVEEEPAPKKPGKKSKKSSTTK
jgi:hypothetical protein